MYRFYGLLPAFAFLLYFPLWYNALFDFHIDHLAVPLLFGFLIMEKKGKIGIAVVFWGFIGSSQRNICRPSYFLRDLSFPYSKTSYRGIDSDIDQFCIFCYQLGIFKRVILTHQLMVLLIIHSYTLGLVTISVRSPLTIFTQPHWVAEKVFTDPERLKYLICLFGALGFIPLLRPGILWITIPILAHSLLSSEPIHYGFTYHYSAGLIIPNIIAFSEGLPQAKKIVETRKIKKGMVRPYFVFRSSNLSYLTITFSYWAQILQPKFLELSL